VLSINGDPDHNGAVTNPLSHDPLHIYGAPVKKKLFAGLSPLQRVGLLVGGGSVAFIMLCCGGMTVVGALVGDPKPSQSATGAQGAQHDPLIDPLTQREVTASPTSVAAQTQNPTTAPPAVPPKVEVRTVTETQTIPFGQTTVNDPTLAKGTQKVKTQGVAGSKKITYEVTYTDGVETGRKVVGEVITKTPVTKVTAIGTKEPPKSNCDPNYTGCVPIASDVDCAGGSGNGPAYVTGPVQVIGTDIYKLDADGDGWACE
jgi:hypothetical protein